MNAPLPLPALDEIRQHDDEMVAIRRQIHSNPELAYEEHATSDLVAERLQRWGYEVHRGLGGTGVVGTLRVGTSNRHIGLRADMDALPIGETSGKPWASKVFGKMHACGHDGHTAMLLAAARHLAATRRFDGHLHLVFQPAEEGLAGAKRMLDDGFLKLFPCEAMFGMHNMPGMPEGQFSIVPGFAMASSDSLLHHRARQGRPRRDAAHRRRPGGRRIEHRDGAADHRVAQRAAAGDGRGHGGCLPRRRCAQRDSRRGDAQAHRARLQAARCATCSSSASPRSRRRRPRCTAPAPLVQYQRRYPMLYNHPEQSAFCERVVREWLGDDGLVANAEPVTGSEDFAFFLEQVPGCYVFIGNGVGDSGGCMVHNPGYDFNDRVLSTGASYWVRIAETYLNAAQC